MAVKAGTAGQRWVPSASVIALTASCWSENHFVRVCFSDSCSCSIEIWKGLTENCQKDVAKIMVFSSKRVFLDLFSDKMFPNMLKLQVSNYDFQYLYPCIALFTSGVW